MIERSKLGVLIVGHGTRNGAGQGEFLNLARLVAKDRPDWEVQPCFLELAQPDILTGLAALRQQRIAQLAVMPLLLFSAGHAKRDIPDGVDAAWDAAERVPQWQASPLGCHEAILQLSAERYHESLAGRAAIPLDDTLILFVGRGSYDDEASAEMIEFARQRAVLTPAARVETCFYAMARPSLAETLPRVAALGFRRVVVQPHLLFQGDLLVAIARQAAACAAAHPEQEWIMTNHLGSTPLLARAVAERIEESRVELN